MEVEKRKRFEKKAAAFSSCCRDQMGQTLRGRNHEQGKDGFCHEQVAVMRECHLVEMESR